MLQESAKSRGLRGNVGTRVAWAKILRGWRELRGQNHILRRSTFRVGHNFYVGCVSQMYFCVGQIFYEC